MLYFFTYMSNYDNAEVIEISQGFDRITVRYRLPLYRMNSEFFFFLRVLSAVHHFTTVYKRPPLFH